MKRLFFIVPPVVLFILFLAVSCSTVKVIPDGEYRLRKNKITVVNSTKIKEVELLPYVRQKPNSEFLFGWNPFLSIYNWSNGKGNGWDRFVSKLGQAPVVFDSTLVKKSDDNIKAHLKSIGYFNSIVKDSVTFNGKKAYVNYYVWLGKRYKISKITYQIKDSVLNAFVMKDTLKSLVRTGKYLSEQLLEEESVRITSLLRDAGYYNFSKNYFFFEADTLRKDADATLVMKIENFTRNENPEDARKHEKYYIRNITVFPSYDPTSIESDKIILNDTIDFKGFKILSPAKPIIKPSVIDKMNRIVPGSIYNESLVTKSYDRLVSLRLFSGVNIQFDEVQKGSTDTSAKREVDCVIRLTPSKMQGYKINVEASSNSNGLLGISPAITYYHKNIFRGGEWLNLGFMGNFQFKLNDPVKSSELGVSVGISTPNFLLLPDRIFKSSVPRTDINVSYNYQNRPEFTRNLISLNYGYNWSSGKFYYRVYPIQLSIVKLNNISSTFFDNLTDPFLRNSYKNHFDMGAGATIYYTTDPSPYPKVSFFYVRWINDISGNLISIFNSKLPTDSTGAKTIWKSPYSQYFRSDLTVSKTWRLDNKNSFSTRFNIGLGYAYGNSKSLPFEKLFYAGGANSLRGWQARTIGPGSAQIDTTFSIPNQTGDFKLEVNAEYRFNMFWKVEGALFADAGNIWTLRSEPGREEGLFKLNSFYKSIAFNWGVGARLNLDFVILRLDLGMVAYDPVIKRWIKPGEWFRRDTYSLQFGVGYPF